MRSIDETGKEYGTLLVQCKLPPRNGKTHWRCLCDVCGKTSDIAGSDLRSGKMGTCACQHDKREYPNVLGLQKQIDAQQAQIKALEDALQAVTARLDAAPLQPEPPPPLEAPAVAFKGPKVVQGPVARLEAILAIPFEQRTDPEALKKEMRQLMHEESVAITEAKEANGFARCFDKDLKERGEALVAFSKKINTYHLNPRDL